MRQTQAKTLKGYARQTAFNAGVGRRQAYQALKKYFNTLTPRQKANFSPFK